MNNCPTCGAPKPNDDWDWSKEHLWNAAPDLLLALRRLLAMWEREFGPSKGRADPGGACLAIAKAEGRVE